MEKSQIYNYLKRLWLIRVIRRVYREMEYIKMPIPIGVLKKIYFRTKGYIPDRAVIYDLTNHNITNFLPDDLPMLSFAKRNNFKTINEYFHLIPQDKIISNEMLARYVAVPTNIAYINKGEIMPLNDKWCMYKGKINNIEKAIFNTNLSEGFFLKPLRGGRGRGVMKLTTSSNNLFLNNKYITAEQLNKMLCNLDHYIIQEGITQDEFGACLFPKSINTMRLITMVDPYNYETFMPFGVQRVAVEKSAPLDNFSAGGITFPIDMNTGTLGRGGKVVNYVTKYYDHHPDTGMLIKDRRIPNWSHIKNSIINLAQKFPYLKFLSWDVIVRNGDILVVEFGNTTDVDLIQIHFPILLNQRVRKFFEYHKFICS